MSSADTGKLGENAVCEYLAANGWKITSRNFRTRGGEIDIIAENGEFIAFVEVKTRRLGSMTSGFEAIDSRKKMRIIKTAAAYSYKFPLSLQPRFDIAVVTAAGGTVLDIDYIDFAYDTSDCDVIFTMKD